MNLSGIILGAVSFLLIGIFHPLVIKAEYYFGKGSWWVFAVLGVIFCTISVFCSNLILSAVIGVAGFSSFWSILEIFKQEERVEKGWFPKNPKRTYKN